MTVVNLTSTGWAGPRHIHEVHSRQPAEVPRTIGYVLLDKSDKLLRAAKDGGLATHQGAAVQ